MPRTNFQKVKLDKAQVYMRHTIEISPSVILNLQMENEKECLYISICLYIFINIYIIYHEDMQVVL